MAVIALIDDDENIVTSVSLTLEAHGYEVRSYHDGAEGLDALEANLPNLVILDIKMPRMDGMEVLRRLRKNSSTPVIMLTSKDEEVDEVLGFSLGADDYIRKPFSQRLLLERVRAVLRRAEADVSDLASKTASARVIRRGRLTLDPERHDCLWDERPVRLTVTEFLILESLASRPGFVKSRDSLMDVAYRDDVCVDDRNIDSHVKRMRSKFRNVDPEFDAIETLYGIGYRFRQ